jgi:nucleotide-binding universal stress UspA family protein
MFKHVLLPTDGSKLSEIAVQSGVQFAKSVNARVTGCSVVPKLHFFNYDSDMPTTIKEQAIQECKLQAESHLDVVRRTAKEAGVPCDTVCGASDQPYDAIIKTAEEKGCDLIMMASHGRRGVSSLLIGSETQKVLTHSKIPVLVYR